MKAFIISLLFLFTSTLAHSADLTIKTTGHPTLGDPNAPIQVIAFLEPKCPDSKKYNNASFPKLKSEFIDTKKVRYTVITTSFLPQSMPAAIALMCVYYQQPSHPHADLFFKYLDYIYQNQPPEKDNWATTDALLKFAAKASPTIDQEQLKKCIEKDHYKAQIEQNTDFGNNLMGRVSTPTIFVDGVKVENSNNTIDYAKLKTAIQKSMGNK